MMNLKLTNKKAHSKFIIWNTSQYCAGFPRDLVIEQVLMRSLKDGWQEELAYPVQYGP